MDEAAAAHLAERCETHGRSLPWAGTVPAMVAEAHLAAAEAEGAGTEAEAEVLRCFTPPSTFAQMERGLRRLAAARARGEGVGGATLHQASSSTSTE